MVMTLAVGKSEVSVRFLHSFHCPPSHALPRSQRHQGLPLLPTTCLVVVLVGPVISPPPIATGRRFQFVSSYKMSPLRHFCHWTATR